MVSDPHGWPGVRIATDILMWNRGQESRPTESILSSTATRGRYGK